MITSYAAAPVSVAEVAVLFAFDDHSLPLRDNLSLTLGSLEKHPANPVVRNGGPGSVDERRCHCYATVLEIDGKLRMWYTAIPRVEDELKPFGAIGYAESDDGVRWVKPNLGLVQWKGSSANNLCRIEPTPDGSLMGLIDYVGVLYEPDDPDPGRRYKATFTSVPIVPSLRQVGFDLRKPVQVMTTAVSADGLTWRLLSSEGPPVPEAILVSGSYRFNGLYHVGGQQASPWVFLPDGTRTGRVIGIYTSPDFVQWSTARSTGYYRPGQESAVPGEGEETHTGVSVWNRGNVLVGMTGLWHGRAGTSPRVWDHARADLGLLVSNDGLHFREPVPGFPFIRRGSPNEWDGVALLHGMAYISRGEKTMIWYSHWDCARLGYTEEIGLATMRRDGFGYLRRHRLDSAGHVVSCPLASDGPIRLSVNAADVTPDNPLRLELLDRLGRPLAGYVGEKAATVDRSGTRVPVRWPAGDTIDPPREPFRIRLTLDQSDERQRLYAIYVEAASGAPSR